MYTVAQLEHKTFSDLKAIAREFGLFPATDRRCHQSWIDALVNAKFLLARGYLVMTVL